MQNTPMNTPDNGCIGAITVYGASSRSISDRYLQAARALGREIAGAGRPLVCGGGATGVMGAAIDGALAAGGRAIGVIPDFMVERQWHNPALTELIVTEGMHPRKREMATLASAVIACAGGIGTFEELMEMLTWRDLGLWHGNIVILNTDGYYDPLLEMLNKATREHFMRSSGEALWYVASTPQQAVEMALRPCPSHNGFNAKS